MDAGRRYFQWLTYVAVICLFGAIMFATFGEAAILVFKNVMR
ncbi:hypothetical protein [Shewanella woodyi]